jgi:hypothetical protein
MASGHVNRTNRPNTWLHRPSLRREESPCQSGAVHTWHLCDFTPDDCSLRRSGLTVEMLGTAVLDLADVSRIEIPQRNSLVLSPIRPVDSFFYCAKINLTD